MYFSFKKVDLIKEKKIAGVVIDQANSDDTTGQCDGKPYPVVRLIKRLLEEK